MARDISIESDSIWPTLLLMLSVLVAVGGGIWYGLALYQPPPQKIVVISTGGEAGAYHAYGKRYQAALQKSGVKVELRTSRGSIENLQRLVEEKTDVALMQGGIGDAKSAPGVVSLGRIFFEPLWIFHRAQHKVERISDLKTLKIAVGPEGSGTRQLALSILGASRIDSAQATLLPITGTEAVDALLDGSIDVAMLVIAPESAMVQKLLRAADVRLLNVTQADALSRMQPYLARVTLPRGVIDLEQDLPAQDIQLVAPVASLVVRDGLHPALVSLFAQAALDIHSGPSLLQKPGEFPQVHDSQFPMSADAQRIYRSGPPFLQRYLPFWVANLVERIALLLLPLATIALPLSRMLPGIYRWRTRRRLNYWYGRLAQLEIRIRRGSSDAVVAAQHAELARIREAVQQLKIPNAFAEQYYTLRNHIDFVAGKLGIHA